jgi:heme exporter protein B
MSSLSPILRKDLRAEFRSRYGVSVVVMFLLVTITTILFSAPGETFSSSISSAFFWISLFFGAMTGLSRSFVTEEEHGTSLILRLYTSPERVYWGKFLYNILLIFALAITAVLFFLFFFRGLVIADVGLFALQLALGCIGIASATTILSAIVARAAQKGALLPVIALPVLMPLIIAVTDATRITLEIPNAWEGVQGDILIMFSFDISLTLVSYVLFGIIWRD